MDEPTVGLHMSDIGHLLEVINRLVDTGNTVIVIEHNQDVIKNADWIIDMGPEGGNKGGRVIFEGTPGAAPWREAFPDGRSPAQLKQHGGINPRLLQIAGENRPPANLDPPTIFGS